MSRPQRSLRKIFIIYCEGDTEYHYINHMRKNQGVELSLKPVNMKGGGYLNFLDYVKSDARTIAWLNLSSLMPIRPETIRESEII